MTKSIFRLFRCSLFASFVAISLLTGCKHSDVYTDTEQHYGEEVERLAAHFDMPPEYFKALIILECSGKKEVPPRFENHIFKRLKRLKHGKMPHYETIKPKDLKHASETALVNLASSWGPFQLMGYHCIQLGVDLKEIRGEDSLYWGFYWIDKTYGNYVRQKRYAEAFRIHNTGSPSGKAHGDYVKNGLKYIAYFSKSSCAGQS